MAYPAFADQDHLHHVMLHSRGQSGHVDTIAGQLANMYGLQKQRHLTMGGGYQADIDYTKISALSQIPHIDFKVERHTMSSAHNNAHELDKLNFQLDMIQAAGSMTAELKDVIAELSEKSHLLTEEQQFKFVRTLFNTYQLQQATEGRIELTRAQMEKLAMEMLDDMTLLARDIVLPEGLKKAAVRTIRDAAEKFGLDNVFERLDRFEAETSAGTILRHSVDALKATLMALMEQDELGEALKQEIQDILDALDGVEDGNHIPRDVMKALESLSDKISELSLADGASLALKNLAEQLAADTAKTKEANIILRAEKSGLTVAQIRALDAYMDKLEALAQELPEDQADLKSLIAEAVAALDADPVSVKSLALTETLSDKLKSPALDQLAGGVADLLPALRDQSNFIQKMQIDGIGKKHDMSPTFVRESSSLYRALDVAKKSLMVFLAPVNDNPARAPIFKPVMPTSPSPSPSPIVTGGTGGRAAPAGGGNGAGGGIGGGGQPVKPADSPKINGGASDQQGGAGTGQDGHVAAGAGENPTADGNRPEIIVEPPKTHPIIEQIDRVMTAINEAPNRITTAVETLILATGEQMKNMMPKVPELKVVQQKAENFVKTIADRAAEKLGKPAIEIIKRIKEMVQPPKPEPKPEPPRNPDSPTPKQPDNPTPPIFTPDQKTQAQADDLFNNDRVEKIIEEQKKKKKGSICETCNAAFCGACGAGSKVLTAAKGALTSAFSSISSPFRQKDTGFNKKPAPSMK